MKLFQTLYRPGKREGQKYCAFVRARSAGAAEKLLEARGIGEELRFGNTTWFDDGDHNLRLRGLVKHARWQDALHEATYLCYLGLKTGVLTADETLGDEGLLHDIVHLLTVYSQRGYARERQSARRRVERRVARFEARVPGHPKSRDFLTEKELEAS